MNTTIKNMLVGVFVLSAIAVLVSVIMFLKPTVGDGKQSLYVRFSNINNVNVGTRVLFGGKPVGEVVMIEEISDAREQPTDELGRVYFYQLTIHIDSSVKVFNTDEISIQTSGLLGEKSIAITPKAPPKGISPTRITNQPIYADSVDPIQNAMLDFSELASQMEDTFKRVGDWIKDHGDEVALTVASARSALEEMDTAISIYNQSDLIKDVQNGVKQLNTTFSQISYAMQEMEDKQTFRNVGDVMKNLKSTTQNFEVVSQDLAHGQGTLGRLISDDDLYLQMNAVMTKANNLMNDVNHYGLMFHLNKQWQRTRLQKINELNSLQSPQAFRCFFQTEVDDINSSMMRISMLLDKADQSKEKKKIFQSPEFKDDFANLLKRVEELSDNLRLYNQQLHDMTARNDHGS